MEKGIQKSFRNKFPELVDIIEDFGILEMESKIKTAKAGQTTKRKVAKITHNDNEEDIYGKLVMLKTECEEEENIALHKPEKMGLDRFKKMTEAIFHDCTTQVIIYIKEGDKEERNPNQITEAWRTQKKKTKKEHPN
ncbi:unnamed protein product [Brassicogethes aeneus]|uniref:Uncharacterized protein n=1 Tax=Brassicogethes aeneus TaxID=1431903 RepID=A0A9P0BAP2_BRAAE|nr:unnamed protein product [Brassicogethes aeneus]